MSDILDQILEDGAGKKIIDIDDIIGYSNNYGSIDFDGINDSNSLEVKIVDFLTSVGYKNVNSTGESFNSYPEEDDAINTTSNYLDNNEINKAFQEYSHARNLGTVANDRIAESTLGQYNISTAKGTTSYGTIGEEQVITDLTASETNSTRYDTNYVTNALLIIGDGSDVDNRHNLLTIRSACTGGSGAGTMSFSGSIDVDGHLNVNDYIYSPTIYTSSLKYPDGIEFEIGSESETFKLFDDEDENTTLSAAKISALEWVESADDNKAFYRDPDVESQEVYQILSNLDNEIDDVYVPVATSETVNIYALNYSLTNNLMLGTHVDSPTDYTNVNAVRAIGFYDGVLSQEFIDTYCINADEYLQLCVIYNIIADIDDSKIGNYMNKAYNNLTLLEKDLSDYVFLYCFSASQRQAYCIPIEKETGKIIFTDIRGPSLTVNGNTLSFDWVTDTPCIQGTNIPKAQLAGTWYSKDKNCNDFYHNKIYEVFPELLWYNYYGSLVPTVTTEDSDGNLTYEVKKWKSWYQSIKIGDVFEYVEDNGVITWTDGINSAYDPDMDLLSFLQYAYIYDLADNPYSSEIKPMKATSKNTTINFPTAEDLRAFISQGVGEDSTLAISSVEVEDWTESYGYWVDTEQLKTNLYDEETLEFSMTMSVAGKFEFLINTSSVSEMFKTVMGTSSIEIDFLRTDTTRYVSQVNTGKKHIAALSLSDDDGSTLSFLGSEGIISTNQISWANLLDALNQNKMIDVLGEDLTKLKTTLSGAAAGTYGIQIGEDGSISLVSIE